MPLTESTSKEAFGHNVAAEMNAGKPQKQAVAIAYSVKRKAGGKKSLKTVAREHMAKAAKGLRT